MATATKKRRAAPQSMAFRICEDNAGSYYWRILAGDGAILGQSVDFASYHDAEQAVQQVRDGAASARFELSGSVASAEPAQP